MPESSFQTERCGSVIILRLHSEDETNRLTRACVVSLIEALSDLKHDLEGLVITGNNKFFSAGAELAEIAALTGPAAYEFAQMGQRLMMAIENFPAPVYAAIS